MLIIGHKGLQKLKIKIHNMRNQTLLNEWQSIRLINSYCSPHDIFSCESCNIARCFSNLTYEEIITAELLNRGLFDFALNNCLRYKVTHIYEP